MRVDELPSWQSLIRDSERLGETEILSLLELEADRLNLLSLEACGIHIDFSKNLLDRKTLTHLLNLASERAVENSIERLFRGEIVNETENRPALHTLLRADVEHPNGSNADDRFQAVANARLQMATFTDDINSGALTGYDGERITDIVNLGIGGSHLGPALVYDALRYQQSPSISVHFVSNVDGGELDKVLQDLDPRRTLFVVASKSFTTVETLLNAKSAQRWLMRAFNDPAATGSHFVAVTAAPTRAEAFGIAENNVFPMWDWVGGRYSLWSAIGLPICIALGNNEFSKLLSGARAMDEHFRTAPIARNVPVLMALIGIWNSNFLGAHTQAIVPYDDRLQQLPAYLQQLEMESNGKRASVGGQVVNYDTAPVLWGGVGTNAQHAFFQQLHQGTSVTPVDFIVAMTHQRATQDHHDMLVANCFAQAQALMSGRRYDSDSKAIVAPVHRECPGNRPSTMIAIDSLNPETLGALLAMYEHKTYVQGVIWDIDPFDQWGVELGKNLASAILNDIEQGQGKTHDPSTNALLRRYRSHRRN